MASASAEDVRDVIDVNAAGVPDAKVLKMIKRADVTLELSLELDREQPLLAGYLFALLSETDHLSGYKVAVRRDLHSEMGKLALLNDLRIYELTNAIIEDALRDQEKMRMLIRRLRL